MSSSVPKANPGLPGHRSCASPAQRLEEAFAQFQAELLGTLFYLVGNREDASDALQEAFVKCWKHQAEIPEVQNLKAWIFRIALNTGRDIRSAAWRRKRKALPEEETMLASPHAGPSEQIEADERVVRLRAALQTLREEEQEVFLLRQNGELTYEQIADLLTIPVGTVKTRMRLAVVKLREVFADGSE